MSGEIGCSAISKLLCISEYQIREASSVNVKTWWGLHPLAQFWASTHDAFVVAGLESVMRLSSCSYRPPLDNLLLLPWFGYACLIFHCSCKNIFPRLVKEYPMEGDRLHLLRLQKVPWAAQSKATAFDKHDFTVNASRHFFISLTIFSHVCESINSLYLRRMYRCSHFSKCITMHHHWQGK